MPAARRSPGQGAGRAPRDDEVERLDERLGHRPRPLPRRGRLQRGAAHAAPILVVRMWSVAGSETATSTRSSSWSAVTPSLRAS